MDGASDRREGEGDGVDGMKMGEMIGDPGFMEGNEPRREKPCGLEGIQVVPDRDYGNHDEVIIRLKHGVQLIISVREGRITRVLLKTSEAQ